MLRVFVLAFHVGLAFALSDWLATFVGSAISGEEIASTMEATSLGIFLTLFQTYRRLCSCMLKKKSRFM